jgi:hypothetical protein
VYQYKVTYVTAFGETDGNTTASSQSTTSTASLNLSAIPVSPDGNVTHRKIYRTVGGGSTFLLLTTLDASTTTFIDTIADGSLGAAIPTLNSAHSRQIVNGILKLAKPTVMSVETGITAAAGGGQTNAYQLASEVSILAVVATTADSVKLPELSADQIGLHVTIANNGANSANIFPALAQDASAGANTAVAIAATARAEFVAVSATAWVKTR